VGKEEIQPEKSLLIWTEAFMFVGGHGELLLCEIGNAIFRARCLQLLEKLWGKGRMVDN